MDEKNIKPSAVEKVTDAIENIMKQMQKMGLTKRDLRMLIRDRTGNKVNMTDITSVLSAIEKIEGQFERAQKR